MSTSMCIPYARKSKPFALPLRSSYWYATFVIALAVTTDMLIYSIVIPVFPFRLESLGYNGISGLVGWLLFSYSAGLVVCTIPIAMLSEQHSARALPLNVGIILLIGSQLMLMFVPNFWLMCIARILQGFSSSIVWVVGLALICDMTPEKIAGRQLGIVMSGFSLGSSLLMGPSIGGALYTRFGFHGTVVFGIALAFVDLVARAFIIERKDALRWGYDPLAIPTPPGTDEVERSPPDHTRDDSRTPVPASGVDLTVEVHEEKPALSLVALIIKLCKSSRALTALGCTLVYGLAYGAIEPALPLHIHALYNFNPSQVGITFLATSVPSLFSTPLSGVLADKRGTEWATMIFLSMTIPWSVVVAFDVKLPLFITALAIWSFFMSGVLSPLMSELANVSRVLDGVGYAHVYGAFNIIYGIGSAVGSVMGGQMYDHIRRGWLAIYFLIVGMLLVAIVFVFCFTGDVPLRLKLRYRPSFFEAVAFSTSVTAKPKSVETLIIPIDPSVPEAFDGESLCMRALRRIASLLPAEVVLRLLVTEEGEILEDYGFEKLKNRKDADKLFSLYVQLFRYMEVSAKDFHRWRLDGVLVEEIKRCFENIPEADRGEYYAWFLDNTYAFDPSTAANTASFGVMCEQSLLEAWVQAGGSPTEPKENIQREIRTWPPGKHRCFELYCFRNMGNNGYPPPFDSDLWIDFGWCCASPSGHVDLLILYRELMQCCTFDELHAAYSSSSLMQLFDKHNIGTRCRLRFPDLENLLSGSPHVFNSVWFLKQYLATEDLDVIPLPAHDDYGFMNCKNDHEVKELKTLYTMLLHDRHPFPSELHLACVQGRLFEFINKHIPLKKKKKLYTRLLKNRYPLPDPDS